MQFTPYACLLHRTAWKGATLLSFSNGGGGMHMDENRTGEERGGMAAGLEEQAGTCVSGEEQGRRLHSHFGRRLLACQPAFSTWGLHTGRRLLEAWEAASARFLQLPIYTLPFTPKLHRQAKSIASHQSGALCAFKHEKTFWHFLAFPLTHTHTGFVSAFWPPPGDRTCLGSLSGALYNLRHLFLSLHL